MDKKQQEILKIVSTCLPKTCSSASCYCYGSIPKDKFRNACNEYAGFVDYSECIGLTDETVFGSAKRGFLFTFDGFYYDGCSSKSYYTEGIKFNSLSSLYNLSAMNSMLERLYQAATKKSGLETFLDAASAVAGEFLEQAVDQLQQERELEDRKETEEMIDTLKACKTFLKEYQSMLGQLAEKDFDEMDSEDFEAFFSILFRSAAVLSNDREMYERIEGEALSEETEQAFDSVAETLELLTDLLEMQDEDHKPVYLRQAIQAYHSSVEAILDKAEDAEYEIEDAIYFYNKGKDAAGKLRKKMKDAINRMNDMIELAYEELED